MNGLVVRSWVYLLVGTGLVLAVKACAPEPVAVKQGQTASVLMVQKQAQADAAARALEAVYSRMSDTERMKGVVYE